MHTGWKIRPTIITKIAQVSIPEADSAVCNIRGKGANLWGGNIGGEGGRGSYSHHIVTPPNALGAASLGGRTSGWRAWVSRLPPRYVGTSRRSSSPGGSLRHHTRGACDPSRRSGDEGPRTGTAERRADGDGGSLPPRERGT